MKRPPESVRSLVEELGGAASLAKVIGVSDDTIRAWVHRGSVPDTYRPKLIKLASRRAANAETVGDDREAFAWRAVDHELLSRISAARANRGKISRPAEDKISA